MPLVRLVVQTISQLCYCGRRRSKLKIELVTLFLCVTLTASEFPPASSIQLSITEGDGLIQTPGSTSYQGVTVLVTDAAGQPIAHASVTFRLPDSEPSGTFPTGSHSEEQLTDAKGKASSSNLRHTARVSVKPAAANSLSHRPAAGFLQ